jgi:hypothetical protein
MLRASQKFSARASRLSRGFNDPVESKSYENSDRKIAREKFPASKIFVQPAGKMRKQNFAPAR